MAFNLCAAFLQMLSMCYWNVKLLSKNTPKIFFQVLLCICQFYIIMPTFKLELQMKWHLSGLTLIWLSANYWKRVFEALCNSKMTSSKSLPTKKVVLLSAWLGKSASFIMKNKSHKNMLNKRSPKIDPWGTPNKISSHELNSKFIFVLCFLFAK